MLSERVRELLSRIADLSEEEREGLAESIFDTFTLERVNDGARPAVRQLLSEARSLTLPERTTFTMQLSDVLERASRRDLLRKLN